MNFVPCLAWVKKGVAKATPEKLTLLKEQLEELIQTNAEDKPDEDDAASDATDEYMKGDADDINEKYDLNNYDDETDAPSNANQLAGLAVYASNTDDPYMSGKSDEEGEEIDDYTIRPSDNLVAVARVNDDCATIEIYVSNEAEDHLYVHHDIIVEAYPVCIEWLSYDPTEASPGNFIAVGDMTPYISVWDLDIVDTLEPAYKLGKKTPKTKPHRPSDGHTDAVISLSWNRHMRQVLASGSADHKAMTWDLSTGVPNNQITGHNEKVQSIQWHPFEASTLLTGSCDHTVKVWDCRSVDAGCKSWNVHGEVEKVLWNHFDPFYFYASTEEGFVYGFDARSDKAVFTLQAHGKAVTSMTLSMYCPGCLVTASADKKLKVWDVQDQNPVFVFEMDAKVGSVLAMSASPDDPFLLAVGGDNHSHSFKLVNLKNYEQIGRFENRHLVRPSDVASGHMEPDSTVGAFGDLSLAGPSKSA